MQTASASFPTRLAGFFGAGVPSALSSRGVHFCIALFFGFVFWVASFGGDFPLNDDWSYAETVRVFLESGRLYMPTACAAGFAHIGWGLLFSKLFGYSYVVLRLANIVVAVIGAYFVYLAVRELGLPRRESLFCALVYAGNPININLYLGFMSDVPALSLSAMYLYYLLAALRKKSFKLASIALALLLVAITIRQSCVVLALAAPTFLLLPGGDRRNKIIFSALFLLLPVLTFWGVDHWLMLRETNGGSLVDHYSAARAGHGTFLSGFVTSPLLQLQKSFAALGVVACYQGLFVFPLLLSGLACLLAKYRLKPLRKPQTHLHKAVFMALLAAVVVAALSAHYEIALQHALMPFCENILRVTSVGAQGIMGIANPIVSARQKMRLTIICYLLATLFLTQFFAMLYLVINRCVRRRPPSPTFMAVIITSCATLGFITVETLVRCTDRYYLIALLPVILLVACFARVNKIRMATGFGCVLLACLLYYSLAAGQDYLASNAARWRGLARLESQGVKSASIDGGAEYNILRDMDIYATHYRGAPPRDTWRWWPIRGEEYIVSFSTIPEYDEIWQEKYYSLLTMSEHSVHVLKQAKLNK